MHATETHNGFEHHLNDSRRFDLMVWLVCCVIAAVTLLAYVGAGAAGGRGELIMPLDDVYIHFQYARQMAAAQPYIYNPGEAPTSGATSFLYPYLLAAGYLIGFRDLSLGLWAMIVCTFALLGSLWTIYLLVRDFAAPRLLALLAAATFGLTGSIAWHFMSGMETGLVIFFVLLTLYAFVQHKFALFILAATLLALIRPEGSVLAVAAVIVWGGGLYLPHASKSADRASSLLGGEGAKSAVQQRFGIKLVWLLIPLVACAVQPLVNLALTGSMQATGSAAKSILNTVPHDWSAIITRIVNNFLRMWAEFFTGYSPREGWYVPVLLIPVGFIGLVVLARRRETRWTALLIMGWLLALTGAASTLDTAFWHFKRYQMPAFAVFFLLAAWALAWGWGTIRSRYREEARQRRSVLFLAPLVLSIFVLGFSALIGLQFWRYFYVNVGYVYAQPYQMALWLRANTPDDAVVAVHDVGMMRYMGGRTTLDMVGLTTPRAADYWRNGPGSVAEFLMRYQPDYIASYGEGHGYGLGMLAQTSLYANEPARFEVTLDDRVNVALAADVQGIYQPEWDVITTVKDQAVFGYDNLQLYFRGFQLVDHLDVADLVSEAEHHYQFEAAFAYGGFPTEVHEFDIALSDIEGTCVFCSLVDAGRFLAEAEQFVVRNIAPNQDIQLVTRLVSASSGELDVFVGDVYIDTRIVVAKPGALQELHTLIPRDFAKDELVITIVPRMENGLYAPYAHSIYQGVHEDAPPPATSLAVYQSGAMQLADVQVTVNTEPNLIGSYLAVQLSWYTDGSAAGDYRLFVHLYDDINQPPIAQWDGYAGVGNLPPGNWLAGVLVDGVTISISGLESGTYRLAIGFYNPQTQERLMPTSDVYEVSPDGRLWLGEVMIPNRP